MTSPGKITRFAPATAGAPRTRRIVLPFLAAGLVGAVLPLAGPGAPAAHAEEKKPFSGYSTSAFATPVRLEIYEPTIPIPATPQLELSFGYSTVEADSSSGQGRSSYLWPGDPVGEGLKTIVEQLGLPPELAGPIAAQGYPVQVNSQFPSGPEATADEPFPGLVMRTSSADGAVSASTGFSTDCDVAAPASTGGGLPGLPGVPGLPALPTLPTVPGLAGLPVLGDLTAALPGLVGAPAQPAAAAPASAAAPEPTPEEAVACQIPPALSALVDLGGYVSTSRSRVADGKVVTTSRASLGDVRLLGGIVTISGIHATATSSSDGKTGTPSGEARFGTVTIAGQEFAFGPEGYRAVGQTGAIPGLPDDPAKALKTLGVTLTLPTPERVSDGDEASTAVSALQVEIDTAILAPVLQQIPLGKLLAEVPFPPEAAILKSLLGALPNLAPRVVLTLGSAQSEVDTVQGIPLPDLPAADTPETPDTPGGEEPPGAGGGAGDGAGGGAGGAGTAAPPGGTGGAPGATTDAAGVGDLPAAAPVAAGLPPLFSIPGMLLLGGIALATVAGSYLRRLGAAALGGGASCSHGLDSGLPDLRKA
ncbi:choice-of-anchor P family protein [Nocardioides sp. W7]|uniref:choice-of-anchor P family protein n=1 Tax=Nocardioides sp. W7 TaxID=2931390 RepID=UPI001FD52F5C|nr:choice-of-anchor P family protein [Nocardioides sp. W7]